MFDFALYFFHNCRHCWRREAVPISICRKPSPAQTAWWSRVFAMRKNRFNLPRGAVKATLLIETLPPCTR
ncbi:hypothetical protein ACNKHM_10385 [Shigella sonnei]